jgi:Ribbon-helix-helix protein, copG family
MSARGPPEVVTRINEGGALTTMAAAYQKISVNLSHEVLGALRELAERDGVTMTEVLRRAISTQVFIEDAQREGKAILLRDPTTNELERIHFR